MYEFGDFRLDAYARLLSRLGVTVPLTPKAIDLLLALVEQPGHLLDKETLLKTVWPDSFVEENNLADNIFKLRRVLGEGENGAEVHRNGPEARLSLRRRRARRRAGIGAGFSADRAQQWRSRRTRRKEERRPSLCLPPAPRSRVSVPWLVAGAMTLLAVRVWRGLLCVAARPTPRVF